MCGGKLFLAEGNGEVSAGHQNRLYAINTDGTITELTDGYDPLSLNRSRTHSLAFAQHGDKLFLAEGNKNQANRLYEIACNGTITELTSGYDPLSSNHGSPTYSVAFTQFKNRLFLAEGNYFYPNQLYVSTCIGTAEYPEATPPEPEPTPAPVLCADTFPFSFPPPFFDPSDTHSVALAQCGDKLFLAEGNHNQPNHLYEINSDGTITELTTESNPFSSNNNYTLSVALAQCGDKLFLAEGNYYQPNHLYEINPDYSTITELTDEYDPFSAHSDSTYSVAFGAVWGQAILG